MQQIEGNVLQPIIQGRGFNLHAGVVILAVTAGSSLAGIIGAFLSVPIAALIAVDLPLRPRRAGRPVPRGRARRHAGARSRATSTGAELVREPVVAPGDRPATPPDSDPPTLTPAGGAWECRAAARGCTADDVRTDPGGPTVAQRPEELVELLPEAEPLPRPRGRRRRPGRAAPGWCWCTTWPATSTPPTPARWPAPTCWPRLPHEVIARFDADSLVDYRGHRPRMTFSGDHYEDFAAPEIALYALEDDAGVPFLLLHGAEPDYAWERFVAAVPQLIERLGVTTVVALQAIPMPVPHTRPVTVTAHATRRQLIELVSGVLGRDAHPRQRLGAAGAAARRGRASTRWAWPRTCRTTWPRPPTPPPR